MTMYRIEEGRKATHICIEAETVNHYDWNALHILHTKAEALNAVQWYMTDGNISYTAKGYRYTKREVMKDGYISYHTADGWQCLSEGEAVKMSDLRKADAIMAGNGDDGMAWADDDDRVTVYTMDGESLRVDIDCAELCDDCEAVDVANLEERTAAELEIIRIQPTAQTAEQTAKRCAHYVRHTLRQFPELAEKVLAAIADPANNGRWTDADSVTEIVWPICNAIENPKKAAQEAQEGREEAQATQDTASKENTQEGATEAKESGTNASTKAQRRGTGSERATGQGEPTAGGRTASGEVMTESDGRASLFDVVQEQRQAVQPLSAPSALSALSAPSALSAK